MKELSILIPVYNQFKFTKGVIDYFEKNNINTDLKIELVIVDNNSSDETNKLENYKGINIELVYIKNFSNTGFGFASNQCYKYSKYNNVLFMNNDVMFAAQNLNWVDKLIDMIETNKNTLIGPTYGKIDNKTFEFISETTAKTGQIESIQAGVNEEIYMSGWFLAGTKDTFNTLIPNGCDGPFDSKSFWVYYEDTDLGCRAYRNGVKFFLYSVPVYHIKKQTSKLLNTSQLYLNAKAKFIEKWSK